ncbi:hypothetical protein [Kitasatospora cathayae]|uniref:Uncharacterized protein n=1 Tax=Kitasatospora cathayae TaxID=3004092 RepID=A0ABY7QA21_9ACTN|nr:hypothetical protein [Kitasatospora sp. HUAS 3-15]WBP89498.1 hypothetical protein O1G21_29105 [Kitasatospora sp. HUAS 3-15]
MTLDDLIATLEAADPDLVIADGFTNPHSYRGDYYDLAFEPTTNVRVGDMLAEAREALGTTYQGWKGGDFTMQGYTDCWLAEEGFSGGETLGPLLLKLMLQQTVNPAGGAR